MPSLQRFRQRVLAAQFFAKNFSPFPSETVLAAACYAQRSGVRFV